MNDRLSAAWVLVVGTLFVAFWYYKIKGKAPAQVAGPPIPPDSSGGAHMPSGTSIIPGGSDIPYGIPPGGGGGPPTAAQMRRNNGGGPPALPAPDPSVDYSKQRNPYIQQSFLFDPEHQLSRDLG